MSDIQPTAPTRAQFKAFRDVKTIGEALSHPDMIARFRQAVPKHLDCERMLRVCALAVQKTPKLQECDLMSLLGAMLGLSSLGLEPNTPLGHAYLIPFEKRANVGGKWQTVDVEVQVVIGYRGYIDLARRSGAMVSIHADVVYDGDTFSFEYGSKMHLRHVPHGARDARKPTYAYAHASLTNGEAFEVLPYAQVLKIRDASEGYKSALRGRDRNPAAFSKNPWVAFEHEMVAKTMIRRIAKMLPMSIDMATAVQMDAVSEAGHIDLSALASGPIDGIADAISLTYEQYIDPLNGGGFERDAETAPAPQTPRATPAKPAASAPATAPSAPPAPAAALPSLYLVDEDGELAENGFFRDPFAYANALVSLWRKTDPQFRDAIMENNAEYIAQLDAYPAARALVATLERDKLTDATPTPPSIATPTLPPNAMMVDIPTRGQGQQDMKGYVAAVSASLAQYATDQTNLDEWLRINSPTYLKLPKMIREQIGAAINGANQRINNNTPSFDSDQMPNDDYVPPGTPVAAVAQPAPSKTPDEQRLENWLVEIGQLATEQSIMSFDRGAAWRTILARWLRDDPEKAKIARTALGERYHALTGKEPPAT